MNPALFGLWMAEGAHARPTPGGVVRWTHPNGDTVSGRYVEVDPPRRLVFTYGWQRAEVQIPPGSTTVEVDLVTQDDGATLLTLVHRGLEDGAADAHQGGWGTTSIGYAAPQRKTSAWIRGPTGASPPRRSCDGEPTVGERSAILVGRGAATGRPVRHQLDHDGVSCLRGGRFFASFDQRTGALVVKLPAARVDTLIASGKAKPFAPAGRRFREWAAVDTARRSLWSGLLDEALTFVAGE